jgi:hypothetical protein
MLIGGNGQQEFKHDSPKNQKIAPTTVAHMTQTQKTNTQMKRTSRRRVTNPTDRKPVTDEEQNNRAEHSNIQNKIY